MDGVVQIQTAVDSLQSAEDIAESLVNKKLAIPYLHRF